MQDPELWEKTKQQAQNLIDRGDLVGAEKLLKAYIKEHINFNNIIPQHLRKKKNNNAT